MVPHLMCNGTWVLSLYPYSPWRGRDGGTTGILLLSPRIVMLHGAKPGNGTTLTEADAQDAGGSYFEHILLCTTSVAYGHWASLVSVSGTYGA